MTSDEDTGSFWPPNTCSARSTPTSARRRQTLIDSDPAFAAPGPASGSVGSASCNAMVDAGRAAAGDLGTRIQLAHRRGAGRARAPARGRLRSRRRRPLRPRRAATSWRCAGSVGRWRGATRRASSALAAVACRRDRHRDARAGAVAGAAAAPPAGHRGGEDRGGAGPGSGPLRRGAADRCDVARLHPHGRSSPLAA